MKRASILDDRLIQVDALGKKWASWGRERGQYRMHPLEALRLLRGEGAVLGGGPTGMPEDVKTWDICIEGDLLEIDHRALLKNWYTGGTPATVVAGRLGISRPTLYKNWNIALFSMRTALKAHGLKL